jgi:serine/threonine protein kinase
VSEYENTRDRGGQSGQKQAGIFQSEHDGSDDFGDGMYLFSLPALPIIILTNHFLKLNKSHDPHDEHHILRLRDSFIHRNHLCLVFELLSSNLYELIKQNQFQGLSTQLVKVFTAQLLDALTVLKEARLIHCDLKPENILLKS